MGSFKRGRAKASRHMHVVRAIVRFSDRVRFHVDAAEDPNCLQRHRGRHREAVARDRYSIATPHVLGGVEQSRPVQQLIHGIINVVLKRVPQSTPMFSCLSRYDRAASPGVDVLAKYVSRVPGTADHAFGYLLPPASKGRAHISALYRASGARGCCRPRFACVLVPVCALSNCLVLGVASRASGDRRVYIQPGWSVS